MIRDFALVVGIALVMLSTSCGGAPQFAKGEVGQPTPVDTWIVVLDDVGRTVRLPQQAKRVISLAPSNTEVIFAIGAGDTIVGVDSYSDFPPEAKSKEHVGGFSNTSLEKVVALAPDLVLATEMHAKTLVPEFERRGIPVVVVQPKKVDAVLDSIRLIGKLTGREEAAAELSNSLRRRLAAVTQKVQNTLARPRVYFELDPKLITVGPDSFIHDMIVKAGGKNIAFDAMMQWPQLTSEAMLMKDPEVIIFTDYGSHETPETVKSRPGWLAVSAVRSGRVFKMDPDLTNKPGPRIVQGLEELARFIQPELFR